MSEIPPNKEMQLIAARIGPDLILAAIYANGKITEDRSADPNTHDHRDAWHQGNYCRVFFTDGLRIQFAVSSSARVKSGPRKILRVILDDIISLYIRHFPEEGIGRDNSPLPAPETIKRSKRAGTSDFPSQTASHIQLALSIAEIEPKIFSLEPPLSHQRHYGLYYEKLEGLIIALHLIEQDDQRIIAKLTLQVPPASDATDNFESLPPVPPIKPTYNDAEEDSYKDSS
ncbi:MAG: hypothetical protein OXI34_06145 [Chloroflexota bacterium]|nr:hypothetical protein [Chloroflexota bacterium]MDE2945685.1 hypothetical protein [Chloroflexota bacterium]